MAFWNNKKGIADLQTKLQQRDDTISVLQAELESLKLKCSALDETVEHEKSQQDWQSQVFSHINQFGQSLSGFHQSLGVMA